MANVTDKSILTAAGKALLAQLNAEEKALVIDKMIFANVPNRPEYPQPDDVVPSSDVVHEAAVEQRGRLSVDSVIYSTTLTSQEGPFEFNWTGAYCSEYGVLVTIDHHALTPKTADEPGVSGNTLVRSVVLEYKDIAEITNITVDASTWQYNATPRMKKMDDDVAQSIIDQNGKDWFIEDGFLVTPQAGAFNIKAGAGYVSGNRVTLEFDRNVQVSNKPSFIYVDAHREGTPTGEQVTLFDFVVTAEEKDDYTDTNGVKHFVCKVAQVLGDGSVSDLRPEGESADKKWVKEKAQILAQSTDNPRTLPERFSDFVNAEDFVINGFSDFIKIKESIDARNIIDVHLHFAKPLRYSDGHISALTLSNLNSFRVSGLFVDDATDYKMAWDITRLFDLENVKYVKIDANVKSTLSFVGGEKQGLSLIRLKDAEYFEFNGSTENLYQGFELHRVKVTNVNSVNTDTRYPAHYISCGIINLNSVNNGCRRDFFIIDGCSGGDIIIDSTDLQAGCPIKHYIDDTKGELESNGLNIYYKHRSTGRYDTDRAPRSAPIWLDFGRDSSTTNEITPSTMQNINIVYDVKGGKWGGVISLRKMIDEVIGDGSPRGYKLLNIDISGRFELANDLACVFFNYRDGKNWVAGDTIGNFSLDGLTVLDRSPVDIYFNPEIIMDAIESPNNLQCRNLQMPSTKLGNRDLVYDDKILFDNCNFADYTTRDARTLAQATLIRRGWSKTSDGVIHVATVDNYRCITAINIEMNAYSDPTGLQKSTGGEIKGTLSYLSDGVPHWNGVWKEDYVVGDPVTPVITADSDGKVFINMPEWSNDEVLACLNVELCYNQHYSGQNSTLRGLVSKRFSIDL